MTTEQLMHEHPATILRRDALCEARAAFEEASRRYTAFLDCDAVLMDSGRGCDFYTLAELGAEFKRARTAYLALIGCREGR